MMRGKVSWRASQLLCYYSPADTSSLVSSDILARLSFYTLSSSDEALLSLLPFALRSSSSGQDPTLAAASTSQATSSATALRKPLPSLPALRDSLFLIVLDWQRPQSFLDELRTWISVIKEAIAAAATAGTAGTSNEERSRRAAQEAMLDEMKDALEAHIRGYVPPASNGAAAAAIGEDDAAGGAAAAPADEGTPDGAPAPAIVPVSAPLSLGQAGSRGAAGTAMPLDEGVLDENLGVGIVVVLAKVRGRAKIMKWCSKADLSPSSPPVGPRLPTRTGSRLQGGAIRLHSTSAPHHLPQVRGCPLLYSAESADVLQRPQAVPCPPAPLHLLSARRRPRRGSVNRSGRCTSSRLILIPRLPLHAPTLDHRAGHPPGPLRLGFLGQDCRSPRGLPPLPNSARLGIRLSRRGASSLTEAATKRDGEA